MTPGKSRPRLGSTLLLLLILAPAPGESITMMEIAAFTNLLANVADKGENFVKQVDYFVTASKRLLDLLESVAPYLTNFSQRDSLDLKTSTKLYNGTMDGLTRLLDHQLRGVKMDTLLKMMKMQYNWKVTIQLRVMQEDVEMLSTTTAKSYPALLSSLKRNGCEHAKLSPNIVLDWIYDITVGNCRARSPSSMEMLLRMDRFFDTAKRLLPPPPIYYSEIAKGVEELELLKAVLTTTLMAKPAKDALKVLDKLHSTLEQEKGNSTTLKLEPLNRMLTRSLEEQGVVLMYYYSSLLGYPVGDRSSDNDLCMLDLLFVDNDYAREPLEKMATSIAKDVVALELMDGICTQVKFGNDTSRVAITNKETSQRVTTLLVGIADRLNATLVHSWPEVMRKAARSKIDEQLPAIVPQSQTLTADTCRTMAVQIEAKVKGRGLALYGYQVVVWSWGTMEHSDGYSQYADCGDDLSSCFIDSYRDMHTFVSRLNSSSTTAGKRALHANQWMNSKEKAIKDAIGEFYSTTDYAQSQNKSVYLEQLLEKITGKVDAKNEGRTHFMGGRLLLHAKGSTMSDVDIQLGASQYSPTVGSSSDYQATRRIEFTHNAWPIGPSVRIWLYYFL